MDTQKGYYALIQYCPDPSRLEAANLGVLLFCPEVGFLKARFAQGHERVRRFFGPQDWSFVDAQVQAIGERLQVDASLFRTVEDLQNFVDRRANEIRITTPRPIKVEHPEDDLERLFLRLIGERERRVPATRAQTLFGRRLKSAALDEAVRRNIDIEIPSIKHTIRAPFAYQNGAFNLLEPVGFTAADDDAAFEKASKFAITSEELRKFVHEQYGRLQLVVVGHFTDDATDFIPMVRTILEARNVNFFTLDRIDPLLDDIRRNKAKNILADMVD
jgi:hypothetical protein